MNVKNIDSQSESNLSQHKQLKWQTIIINRALLFIGADAYRVIIIVITDTISLCALQSPCEIKTTMYWAVTKRYPCLGLPEPIQCGLARPERVGKVHNMHLDGDPLSAGLLARLWDYKRVNLIKPVRTCPLYCSPKSKERNIFGLTKLKPIFRRQDIIFMKIKHTLFHSFIN